MKRNERRMKETSLIQLQSCWRANVDVQIIIYETSQNLINGTDIFRVSAYVVSYAMNGSVSCITEQQKMIADLIQSQESLFLDNNNACISKI